MKFISILALMMAGEVAAVHWEPSYYRVSPSKGRAAYLTGRDPELEPLETGTMKSLDEKHELTKGIMEKGFRDRAPDPDSIEERIKLASRNFG